MSAAGPLLPDAREGEDDAFRGVVFRLGSELHACDVRLVEEVVNGARVHPLPDVPRPLLGVIRLRGALVPVLDVAPGLGVRLEETETPDVLVLDAGDRRVGVAVDEAREVAAFPASTVRPAPPRGAEREEHVLGVARAGDALVTLLDLAAVLEHFTSLTTREPS
ncbi:MAG TPA: chemotaxis protein CheW [Longimicrobiaceae bacterium]|nr:chemotaxis protein CheW [Longimicrobiaceae bacterium]